MAFDKSSNILKAAGFWSNLERQRLERADLERQKKRDKALSDVAAANIHLRQKEHELQAEKAETLRKYYEGQVRAELARTKLAKQKEEFAQALDIRNVLAATDEIERSKLAPGEKEDSEDYFERYGMAKAMLESLGLDSMEAVRQLSYMKPLEGVAEKELSEDEKLRALLQSGLISKVPEAFTPILKKEFGLDISPELLKTEDMEPEQRTMLGKVTDLLVDKRITPEEFTVATEKIKAGELTTALDELNIRPERPRAMSGTEMQMMMAYATSPEQRYEIMADNRTARSGREHHAVLNTKGINEWEVVDYERAKMLKEEGLISLQHLQKFNEYWEEEEGTTTKPGKTRTSGGFEY